MAKKILFLITEDWFFESHFMERASAAIESGYNVFVATRVSNPSPTWNKDIVIIPIEFQRSGINPFFEFITIFHIARAFKMVSPDVIHQVAIKPIL